MAYVIEEAELCFRGFNKDASFGTASQIALQEPVSELVSHVLFLLEAQNKPPCHP